MPIGIGRFISPDSIVPDWSNPQAWNPYSYVLNNPLKYTDPTVHYGFPIGVPPVDWQKAREAAELAQQNQKARAEPGCRPQALRLVGEQTPCLRLLHSVACLFVLNVPISPSPLDSSVRWNDMNKGPGKACPSSTPLEPSSCLLHLLPDIIYNKRCYAPI